jgi:hypothetical protein
LADRVCEAPQAAAALPFIEAVPQGGFDEPICVPALACSQFHLNTLFRH